MKLYYSPGACSLSPHIVLLESGLPHSLERVDLPAKKTASGADFYKISPNGYVPALALDNGEVLTEGPAIVQYIADQAPEKKLAAPWGSMERYRLIEWLNFISTELHKGYSPLFNKEAPEEWKAIARKTLQNRMATAAGRLGGRDYLMGEFSVADAYFFTVLRWARAVKLDLSHLDNIAAYMERMSSRPAVHEALLQEGLKTR